MKRLMLALLAVLAVGCSPQADTIDAAEPAPATCTDAGDGLYDCRLKDGLRCVVFAGYKAGGIACDFREHAVEQ